METFDDIGLDEIGDPRLVLDCVQARLAAESNPEATGPALGQERCTAHGLLSK